MGVELEVFEVSDGKSRVLGEELRGSDVESRVSDLNSGASDEE